MFGRQAILRQDRMRDVLNRSFGYKRRACGLVALWVVCVGVCHWPAIAEEQNPALLLQPGEWYEVPDSHLEDVAAKQSDFPWLSGGIGGVIDCWAGGALDTQRDRLYVGPGGGHAGYNGNEVYAFDLHTLKWSRINDPDPVIPGTEFTDLNKAPFAMHTYDGVEYLPPPVDRYVVIGGWGTPRTYALDPEHPGRWEVYADHGTGRTGDISAYDPVSQLLWLSTPTTAGKLSQYDPLSHGWTLRRNESPSPSYYETADVDWRRRLMVSCGKGKLKIWQLTDVPGQVEAAEIATEGGQPVVDAASPGFCYVPAMDRFAGWANGTDLYTLDLDARKWTRHPAAATNRANPGAAQQWGTFGRFRYSPATNLFVVCNSVKQNVYLYRLSGAAPNPLTGVEAKATRPAIDGYVPAPAIRVEACYADGSRKDVTEAANYFSLNAQKAQVDVRGRGVVKGLAGGMARIRAVYTDPAFGRGFASEVNVRVSDTMSTSTLESLTAAHPKLTLPAGDSFPLELLATYKHGADRFARECTDAADWLSADERIVSVAGGRVHAHRPGEATEVKASLRGKTATWIVRVTERPEIRRVSFQVKDEPIRAGWQSDNGKSYTDSIGYGWLDTHDLAQRDDRHSARNTLLMRFVAANGNRFKVAVPAGEYSVRLAMGDSDYGAMPFAKWIAQDDRKLMYYEGHHNGIATRTVAAGTDGLIFAVQGAINYLIVAPYGTDLDKYADDGPDEKAN